MDVTSPTYEEQAKLIELAEAEIRNLETVKGILRTERDALQVETERLAHLVKHFEVTQGVMQRSLDDKRTKLAASEETVREYAEAVAAFVRADVGLTNDPEADSYLDACQALHKLFTNPPSGASALGEVTKLRGDIIAWADRWDEVHGKTWTEVHRLRKIAALGERSSQEGEGS